MSNVFQQDIGGGGPQAANIAAPFVASTPAPQSRASDILGIMEGASRIASGFMQQKAQQQAAVAQAESDAEMGDYYTSLLGMDAERTEFLTAKGEITSGVFSLLSDQDLPAEEKQGLLGEYQMALEELRGAYAEDIVSPYKYTQSISRLQADMISRNPSLRREILEVGQKFATSAQPSTSASERAATVQNDFMSQRYGSSWNVNDLAYEQQRVIQSEQLELVRQRAELGTVQASQIGTAAISTANAVTSDVVSRYMTKFRERGALTGDDIIELRNEWSQLQSSMAAEAISAIDAAAANGSIIDREARNGIIADINSFFDTMLPPNLDDMELTSRMQKIQDAERLWIEHNVPQLPYIRLMSEVGGDSVLAQLVALNQFTGSSANVSRVEGLLNDPTLAMSGSIVEALGRMLALTASKDVVRSLLGPSQQRLWDATLMIEGERAPLTDKQSGDLFTALEENVADAPTTGRAVQQTLDYMRKPTVIANAQQSPQTARTTLATTGTRIVDVMDSKALDLQWLLAYEEGDTSIADTRLGLTERRMLEDYLTTLDRYADNGIGNGREEFFNMVRDREASRQQASESRQAGREQSGAERADRVATHDALRSHMSGPRNAAARSHLTDLVSTVVDGTPTSEQRQSMIAMASRHNLTEVNDPRIQRALQIARGEEGLTEEELSVEPAELSPRLEDEISRLIQEGMSMADIADRLGVDGNVFRQLERGS